MGIKDMITKIYIVDRAGLSSIEAMPIKSQLRWAGYVVNQASKEVWESLKEPATGAGRSSARTL